MGGVVLVALLVLLAGCAGTASPGAVAPVEDPDWSGLQSGPRIAGRAAVAWSGRHVLAYGGVFFTPPDEGGPKRSVSLDAHLYDAATARWSAVERPPGEPIVEPQAAYADGRFLLLGTRCRPGTIRFEEGETACDGPRGVALWLDEATREWSELELPGWLAKPDHVWLRRPSDMESMGTSGSTLFLAGQRVVVSLDLQSGRFEEIYDGSPGLISSRRMRNQIVVVRSPVGGVEARGIETRLVDVATGDVREVETPFARQDAFTVTCGADQAHVFTFKHRYELRTDTWSEIDDWPPELEVPLATGSAGGVELAWTIRRTPPAPGRSDWPAMVFRDGTWTSLPDALDLEQPGRTLDVGDGVVLQAVGPDRERLYHQPVGVP
jgi:hypothetical protein